LLLGSAKIITNTEKDQTAEEGRASQRAAELMRERRRLRIEATVPFAN